MEDKTISLFNLPLLQRTLYFKSDNGFSMMVMKNSRHAALDISLIKIEKMLPSGLFFRVHRNYLVNIYYISEFRYYRDRFFAFVQGDRIPVSRRRRQILMNSLDIV